VRIRTKTGNEALTGVRGVAIWRYGRTGIPAEGDAGCGEVAELEAGIGMTRMAGVCCVRDKMTLDRSVAGGEGKNNMMPVMNVG
jgi:hypothetical protein